MDRAPDVVPVFPLTGVLLLPGGRLPLHVFEPRYRNLVEDALESDRIIGMVQPVEPRDDTFGPSEGSASADEPELYRVGCNGWIEHHETLSQGRFVVLLRGTRRFRIRRELPPRRGYRRVEADYEDFADDVDEAQVELSSNRLIAALREFGQEHQLKIDFQSLAELPGLALMNSVAMALPFAPAEKQALLEAPNVVERHEMLLGLIRMGIELTGERSQAPN